MFLIFLIKEKIYIKILKKVMPRFSLRGKLSKAPSKREVV